MISTRTPRAQIGLCENLGIDDCFSNNFHFHSLNQPAVNYVIELFTI